MSTNDRLFPGKVLGRYELLLPIAQGGMATVWAARQKGSRGFQKTVALKTMLPALSDDAQFEQMFLDEAALAAKIHHPNVAEILDLGEEDEILYLVMEWIDGEALSVIHKAVRKNKSQLPFRFCLRVVSQACSGLHAAHELRDENDAKLELVHRDVSPQNILVTYDGIAKLVDFGVAKAVGRAGGETSAGQLKGKVPYMSPEQARGGHVDRRTDIFAMGIVLYKLTTGLHPFTGDNDMVTMRNIITRPLLPPRVKSPQYPLEVEQVILKALQKDPDKRYQTMLELREAIDVAIASMGVGDDDVGGFVRSMMGERGTKRRAAIRDAVRAADERSSQVPSSQPKMMVHDGVSELLQTRMHTGIKEELPQDRPSQSGSPTSLVHTTTTATAVPSEPTLVDPPRRSRSGLAIAVAVGAMAAAAFAAMFFRGGGDQRAPTEKTAAASPPTASATASATASEAPSASAKAPAASASQGLEIDDLPNADDKQADKKKALGRPLPSRTNAEPKGAGDKPKPVSTQWVPSIQNPGF